MSTDISLFVVLRILKRIRGGSREREWAFCLRTLSTSKAQRQNKRLIIVWRGAPLKARILFSAPTKNTPISGVFFCFRVGRDCRNSELSEVRASAVRKRPPFFRQAVGGAKLCCFATITSSLRHKKEICQPTYLFFVVLWILKRIRGEDGISQYVPSGIFRSFSFDKLLFIFLPKGIVIPVFLWYTIYATQIKYHAKSGYCLL